MLYRLQEELEGVVIAQTSATDKHQQTPTV